MTAKEKAEIRTKRKSLETRKKRLLDRLHLIEILMNKNQMNCFHDDAEEYRGHIVGVCPICGKIFETKHNVDFKSLYT